MGETCDTWPSRQPEQGARGPRGLRFRLLLALRPGPGEGSPQLAEAKACLAAPTPPVP